MRLLTLLILFAGVFIVGCGMQPANQPKVIFVEDDDPQMRAAIAKARNSTSNFLQALKASKPSQSAFSIKTAFSDGKHTEHMWLSPVSYDGKNFQGTVNNYPKDVTGVEIGKKVTVEPGQISDWMYIENKKLVGGYTIRLLWEKMSAKEREEFSRSVPFTLD